MTRDEMIAEVKQIMGYFRDSKNQAAYEAFQNLLSRPTFNQLQPSDQRQALKLLIQGKRTELGMHRDLNANDPLDLSIQNSHRAALQPLTELVSTLGEPEDFELLGMVHQRLGNHDSAATMMRPARSRHRRARERAWPRMALRS
jgi:hypothetical protein